MRRVLLIDPDRLLATLLGSLLAQHDLDLVHASSLAEGDRLLDGSIDLLLLEVTQPDGDGVAFVRKLREPGERRPVIFLTACVEDQDCIRALTAGADDYIAKPFNYLVVAARIQTALRQSSWGATAAVPRHDGLDIEQRTLRLGGRMISLTNTEFKLLQTVTARPGRTFSRDELWRVLDDEGTGGGYDRAIDLHVGRLRGKLEPDTKEPRHLLTVRGVGYRWSW